MGGAAACCGAAVVIAAALASPAENVTPTPQPPTAAVRVVDGDKFHLMTSTRRVTIGPAGYDAAGVGRWAKCSRGHALGVVAEALTDVLSAPSRISITPLRTGRYGLIIASVRVNGADLTDIMLEPAPARRAPVAWQAGGLVRMRRANAEAAGSVVGVSS